MSTCRTVQRVIFPPGLDPDVLALYVEAGGDRSSGTGNADTVTISPEQHPDQVLDRTRLQVSAGTRVSFATYFNAFPAGYWQRWTRLREVELNVRVSGPATVAVYRSAVIGTSERVQTVSTTGDAEADLVFRLPLTKFRDGGWYWFDVVAGRSDVVMQGAEWRTTEGALEPSEASGTVTLGITTYNRPGYLIALLRQLADRPDVLQVVDEVLVVDQGTQRVRDQEAYEEVQSALGGRLRLIEQANLGGSGGFARSMAETLAADRSRYVLLIDDDVSAEPECILRGLAFADLSRRPTIVGGHMLNLLAPSHLHSFGEKIRPWRYSWGPAPHVQEDHDFGTQGLRATPWMHRRIDVDFNAWWMCLIPVEVLKTTGLSLPFFIKWDDAEFGLRAKKAGFPTVSLPGMAVWHMPWTEKDDVVDWQAYFHHRNRVVTALLHSPYPRGGRVVRDSLLDQFRHLLAMQYSVAELRIRALEDVLAGPEHFHAQLATKLPEVRALRTTFADSATAEESEAFPPLSENQPLTKDTAPEPPVGALGHRVAMVFAGLRHLRPVPSQAVERPTIEIPAPDAQWWRLSQLDSALVSTADGASVAWYRRDRTRYTDLLRRSVRVHEQLLSRWPELRIRYQEAAGELVSPETWAKTFAGREG